MVSALERYDDVLAALVAADVRHVVVGGVAVVLRGHPRLTVDLDLALDLAAAPARRAVDALTAVGLVPRLPVPAAAFADPEQRRGWVRDRHLQVFSFQDPSDPLREVDLFAEDQVPFEELYAASELLLAGRREVRVASVEHLIAMKVAAGRPRDLSDVEALRRGSAGCSDGDPWEAATFEGLTAVQARAQARSTPEQRWAWLAGALELAAASGALARALADKQAELDGLWWP